MPKQKQIVELRKMNVDDLIKLGEERRAELFALKFQAVLGSLEQTHRIKTIKKEIARIELVLSELKRAGQDTNKSVKADYNKAVEAADKDGKKVREKQMKMIEELQNQQYGTAASEDDIANAMAAATEETATEKTTTEDKGANK